MAKTVTKTKSKTTVKKANPVGRPKKFKTAAEMQKKIDLYFKICDSNTREVYLKKSQEIVELKEPTPYSVEGLCCVLEMDRKSLINYSKDEEFFHTIKKAKEDVLQNMSDRALQGLNNPAVSIFLLKNNYGYVDRSEVKQEHSGEIRRGMDSFYGDEKE